MYQIKHPNEILSKEKIYKIWNKQYLCDSGLFIGSLISKIYRLVLNHANLYTRPQWEY